MIKKQNYYGTRNVYFFVFNFGPPPNPLPCHQPIHHPTSPTSVASPLTQKTNISQNYSLQHYHDQSKSTQNQLKISQFASQSLLRFNQTRLQLQSLKTLITVDKWKVTNKWKVRKNEGNKQNKQTTTANQS